MEGNPFVRQLGLTGLVATGVCSMLGASINVVPFMIQRHVPGIGSFVAYAFLFAAVPAILAAFAYSILATAMPRAGGSYIYASRGLNPYLGFIASFSQWFGLSIVIGVVAYVTIPFFRDMAAALSWIGFADFLNRGSIRVFFSLGLVWLFVWVNVRGLQSYTKTIIPLMVLMFLLGGIVIVAGFTFSHQDFQNALIDSKQQHLHVDASQEKDLDLMTFFSAAAILFASFIGFDSIAQAGGEAKDPSKKLPLAIGLTLFFVGGYYILFTNAVYHAVPWEFVFAQAATADITAPGLLSYLLPTGLTIAIIAGAAIALINDLPAMLLSVSRLMFAWAEDGIFPKRIKHIHPRYKTPYLALIFSGIFASIGVLGSHFAGNFFLGIDIMVTAMMVNFLLMCLTIVRIDSVNPLLANKIKLLKKKNTRITIGILGILVLSFFLIIHTWKDLTSPAEAWYYHSTPIWFIVMSIASILYYYKFRKLQESGTDTKTLFQQLP